MNNRHSINRLLSISNAQPLAHKLLQYHKLLAVLVLCVVAILRPAAAANVAAPAASGPAAAAQSEDRVRVTVNQGETIMSLIRRTLPNSPYRDDFLRKAFHRMNPDAYVAGSMFRLKSGAVVVVPSNADLQRLAFGDAQAPAPAAATQPRPELERKSWVRYP